MKPIAKKTNYWDSASYLLSTDIDQKKKKVLKGIGGEDIELYITTNKNRNYRISRANRGTIEAFDGKADFKVGQDVLCTHFTFEDEAGIKKTFYKKDGKDYYEANNFEVMFGIDGDELIPREGVLLCESVEDKFLNTTLLVTSEYEGSRRDLVKVVKTWDGCDLYKDGDYILIEKNADYLFDWNGREYIKVDHYFDDVLMIVNSTEWRKTEVHTHSNDHYTAINPMDRFRNSNYE